MLAPVISFSSCRTEIHWDLLAGLAPQETAEIMLGRLITCPFNLEGNIPGFPGGVVFQIFSVEDPMKRALKLEVWGSEKRTTYIKLTVNIKLVPEMISVIPLEWKGEMVELETGVQSPLTCDREGVLQKMLDYLYFVAREQRVAA